MVMSWISTLRIRKQRAMTVRCWFFNEQSNVQSSLIIYARFVQWEKKYKLICVLPACSEGTHYQKDAGKCIGCETNYKWNGDKCEITGEGTNSFESSVSSSPLFFFWFWICIRIPFDVYEMASSIKKTRLPTFQLLHQCMIQRNKTPPVLVSFFSVAPHGRATAGMPNTQEIRMNIRIDK
jgi:hypothetical protein